MKPISKNIIKFFKSMALTTVGVFFVASLVNATPTHDAPLEEEIILSECFKDPSFNSEAFYFQRETPDQEFNHFRAHYIHNFVRRANVLLLRYDNARNIFEQTDFKSPNTYRISRNCPGCSVNEYRGAAINLLLAQFNNAVAVRADLQCLN